MIQQFKVIGKKLFYNTQTFEFSLSPNSFKLENHIEIQFDDMVKSFKPKFYTFCLEISNACNLACDYCFNQNKNGTVLTYDKAREQLEYLFTKFPDGNKYFIDLSGKGEPLLNLTLVFRIADYCKNKSNDLRKEVLPMFVCNGTLLSKNVAIKLQKAGILFGVSLDGNEYIHNKHRLDVKGHDTFNTILSNINSIPNKEYIGCAVTITNDVFDLYKSLKSLSRTFKTISYRLVRGENALTESNAKKWIKQYDKLSKKLLRMALNNDIRLMLCLMNGDDWFGRFLCRAALKQFTMNRCDGGINRFAISENDELYPCSACVNLPTTKLNKNDINLSRDNLIRQIQSCERCIFKRFCGGECEIEEKRIGSPNAATCLLTQQLIKLSNVVFLTIEKENPRICLELQQFVLQKYERYDADNDLKAFLDENPNLSFCDAKVIHDELTKRY